MDEVNAIILMFLLWFKCHRIAGISGSWLQYDKDLEFLHASRRQKSPLFYVVFKTWTLSWKDKHLMERAPSCSSSSMPKTFAPFGITGEETGPEQAFPARPENPSGYRRKDWASSRLWCAFKGFSSQVVMSLISALWRMLTG
ncbi:uncharacterized protein LOC144194791 [Stigmatopora nigra]